MRRKRRGKYNGSGFDAVYHRSSRDYDKVYAKFRKIVRKRDKNKCQMPGCKAKKELQVHHVMLWADCPNLRYEPRNGILLCKKCHQFIKNKEHHYIELFTRIVNEKYDNNPRQ